MPGTAPHHEIAVVLADDDVRFRAMVRSLLDAGGYRVLAEAGDAAGTLHATALHQPDVVVVDLVMEGADGLSLVRDLLSLDPHRPVILISSLFDPILEMEASRLGVWYLEKVEGFEALEHAIDEAISVSHRAS